MSGIEELGRETTGALEERSVRTRLEVLLRASEELKQALAATAPQQPQQVRAVKGREKDKRRGGDWRRSPD